jgi:predicted nucleic acid-binding protein
MPSGADVLVDTSVAVPLVLEDHPDHALVLRALTSRRVGLAGHAAFETFSVLTRLPHPMRRTPAAIGRLLRANFPASRFLGADACRQLLESLAELGISGGAVYDALVGATAREHGCALATRDERALGTYRTLGVRVEPLGG